MLNQLQEIDKLLSKNYLYKTDNPEEYIIRQYIYSQKDMYLNYVSQDGFTYEFLGLFGISVEYINPDMAMIIGKFHKDLDDFEIGDIIIQVDDKRISDISCKYFLNLKYVEITVIRNYLKDNTMILKIKCLIPKISVNKDTNDFYKLYNGDFGIIRFKNFSNTTINNVINAIDFFKVQGIKYICLDLRNNSGGSLKNAIKVISKLVTNDRIIYYMRDKEDGMKLIKTTKEELVCNFHRIIIIVDRFTMSSAEILSVVLREQLDAIIIGEKTFGKGIASQIVTLSNGSKLHIPKYELISIKGYKIHNVGVFPDIDDESFIDISFRNIDDLSKIHNIIIRNKNKL